MKFAGFGLWPFNWLVISAFNAHGIAAKHHANIEDGVSPVILREVWRQMGVFRRRGFASGRNGHVRLALADGRALIISPTDAA